MGWFSFSALSTLYPTPCDRHSCSADRNGRFPFAELHLGGIASGRCQRPIRFLVRMIVNLVIQSPDVLEFVHSYNPAASTSYMPIDGAAAASLTTISGQTATGHFASEICTLQSSTFSPTFTYLASGMYVYMLFPIPIDRYPFFAVVVADSSVTTDLFPPGARAILGYGVNTPSGSPPNASLIPTFLP